MSELRNGLKLISLIPGCGYGDAACEYAAGLDALGVPVSWLPTRSNRADLLPLHRAIADVAPAVHGQMARLWNRPVDAGTFLLCVPPYRWHEHWLAVESSLRPFCHLTWEVEQLPKSWLGPLNRFEKVFVPSHFNREAFINGGVTAPVEVIPYIARDIATTGADANAGFLSENAVRPGDFVFYTIGTWITRKDMETTIRAYLDAFCADDPVVLVVKTGPLDEVARAGQAGGNSAGAHTLGTPWALARILASYPRAARIHLVAQRLEPQQIDQLHRRGDCFVSLTHSEGWGLGGFDAALHGNPVIMTGWGGQLDYLGDDYPLLVDFELRPTAQYQDDGHFRHRHNVFWAQANREHGSALMRNVFESPSRVSTVVTRLQGELRQRFSPTKVCAKLAAAMGFDVAKP